MKKKSRFKISTKSLCYISLLATLFLFLNCFQPPSTPTSKMVVAKENLSVLSSSLSYAPSQPVGTINGEFSVNGNGSATYQIGIIVPPGTGGAAPELQISYDSHRGNGYLGMGWALNGLSSIGRCGASFQLDGFKSGVDFTNTDRFCIDGRRLIPISGTNGANGTLYQTELQTWTTITSVGQCGKGPCYFKAANKDGDSLFFGLGGNSQILAEGRTDSTVRAWAIGSTKDRNGNVVTVNYVNNLSSGEYYPDSISYTSNTNAKLTNQRSVHFQYEPRQDTIKRFLSGSLVQITKRLKTIVTSVSGSSILHYTLNYDTSNVSQRSRLTSVQLCDNNNTCWPQTSFEWNDADLSFNKPTPQLPGPLYVISNNQLYTMGVLMDINADGIADYSQATNFMGGSPPDLRVYLGSSDGTFRISNFSLPGELFRVVNGVVQKSGTLQDINGDGILDYTSGLYNSDASTQDYTIYLGTGTGFQKSKNYTLPDRLYWQVNGQTFQSGMLQDLNGDGLPDYCRASKFLSTGIDSLEIYRGTGTGFVASGKRLPGAMFQIGTNQSSTVAVLQDLTGDGLPEFSPALFNSDNGTKDYSVYVAQGANFNYNHQFDLPDRIFWQVNGQVFTSGLLVDLNGDEIPDYSRATEILSTSDSILEVYLGTGAGYTPGNFKIPGPVFLVDGSSSAINGLLTDLNRDGTTRYSRGTQFADGTKQLDVYLGSGKSFQKMNLNLPAPLFTITNNGIYAQGIYQDINGDGLSDFANSTCTYTNGGGLSGCDLGISLAKSPFPDLLNNVTNGFMGQVSVQYAPITRNLYTKGTGAVFPQRDAQSAMYVVSSFSNLDGKGSHYTYNYTYSGGRVDVQSKGWIGFKTVSMTDSSSGRSTVMEYNQVYPKYGTTSQSEILDSTGSPLSRTLYEYMDVSSTANQNLNIHQVLKSTETFTHYTKDTIDYSLKKIFQFDSLGNLLLLSDLGDTSTQSDDLFTCTQYYNNPVLNQYGFILQSKSSRTKKGCDDFLNTSPGSVAWDSATDLSWSKKTYDSRLNSTSESNYDNVNKIFLTSSFLYDPVGNITQAVNPAGDTTTFQYDSIFQAFRTTTTSPFLTRDSVQYRLQTHFQFESGFGVLLNSIDANGNIQSQTLDGFGRPVAIYKPDSNGNQTLVTTSLWQQKGDSIYLETRNRNTWDQGDTSTWFWTRDYYDGMERNYLSTDLALKDGKPIVRVSEQLFYDAEGRIHQQASPYFLGDSLPLTTTTYDIYNRPILSTDPSGVQQKLDYFSGGLQVNRTLAYGTPEARTVITYNDARGQTIRRVEPNGLTINYTYNPLGLTDSVTTLPTPRKATFQYDALSRLIASTKTDENRRTWAYDSSGYLRSITDAEGNIQKYNSYDAAGRILWYSQIYQSDTSSIRYMYDDSTQKNGLHNLTQVQINQGPIQDLTYTYQYNAFGDVIEQTASILGETYHFKSVFDPMRREVLHQYPNGASLSMRYGADTYLDSVLFSKSGTTSYTPYGTFSNYTALGQLQNMSYSKTGVSVTRKYYPVNNNFGKLQSIQAWQASGNKDTLVSKTFDWNVVSEITGIMDHLNSQMTESFGYTNQKINEKMGFLTSANGPYGSKSYNYDSIGNITNQNQTNYTYQPNTDYLSGSSDGTSKNYYKTGNLSKSSNQNTNWDFRYSASGEMTDYELSTGHDSIKIPYVYDHTGRLVYHQEIDSTSPQRVPVQIIDITENYSVLIFSDSTKQNTITIGGPFGPLATVTDSGTGSGNLSRSNHFNSFLGMGIFTHIGFKFSDYFDHLHHIHAILFLLAIVGVGLLCYLIMVFSHTKGYSEKKKSLLWTHPLFAITLPILVPALFFLQVNHVYGNTLQPGDKGSGIPSVGEYFFIQDLKGSTVLVTDTTGSPTAKISYDPYGAILANYSSGIDNFRPKYESKFLDGGTGYYFFGARFYDPGIGRFISPDPQNQYLSPYVFGNNNPISHVDPTGEFAVLTAFVVSIIIGAVVGAYFGAAAVNHDFNPAHWDWQSGKTYAGLLGGAAIGAVGAAAGGVFAEAGVAVGALGGTAAEVAGTAIGIAGDVIVGAGENAAFTALGGGSNKEILESALQGAATGGLFGIASRSIGSMAKKFGSRGRALATDAEEGLEGEVGACGCTCGASFVAGTPVVMEEGVLQPIETLVKKKTVAGFDFKTSATGFYEVIEPVEGKVDSLTIITLESGTTISSTTNHSFRLFKRGWVQAQYINSSDLLTDFHGNSVAIKSVQTKETSKTTAVYNIRVEDVHNYYITTDSVLVKNPHSKGGTNYCDVTVSGSGVLTENWSRSEIRKRYPLKAHYQAIERDIRYKARSANKIIKTYGPGTKRNIRFSTRSKKPVKTASMMWIRRSWNTKKFGPMPGTIRPALQRLRNHFTKQDVDEFVARILGGLTVREGLIENQGPLNYWVNSTSGSAVGRASRTVPHQLLYGYRAVIK